ncbi:MAG: Type IV pilus inner membrane protein PilC [Candidatus Jorgensenbacteria bacterium GW2011_GWF2_41_8]|uniref:Type IV pilus inner membrane protein PilC n=1 Tax=Candidatus Jorgensenbacteria bacterium GW2011_GWF2_41_8 TaxID=1618667 RepID=A0A0G1AIB8_9BACT|nr:MAG: Type IV pilus inner membrane protein PilC [Candidatus Jorgensenbacteria bacterium GW2011_GWF2_41_8]
MEFNYKIKTQNGELIEGNIEAPDENAAVNILHEKGYVVLSLRALKKDLFSADLNQYFSKPNNKDIVIFTRQLSTLIDADMPLAEGLRTLARQVDKPGFKKVITEISEAVEGGSSLSGALAAHSKMFNQFYIKLVQTGEISGKLHETLLYLADYLEKSQTINSKIRGALAYPAFVVFALVVVTIIMMVYVLPQLLSIFKEVGSTELPFTTRILIFTTEAVNKFLYPIVIVVFGGSFLLWRYIKTPEGKARFDNLKINFPSLGSVIRNLYLARMSESLATLIKSGIPILDGLKITADLVGNTVYQKILLDAEENVRGGGNISEVLEKRKEIPPLMSSMVAIGEKTGKLNFMLDHVSKFYKSESDNAIENISTLIEPILVLILGFAVAVLVSAILLPIYNLVGVN